MRIGAALLIFSVVWAAIYLPHLGTDELRGEEARRILPAQAMVESGDWVVPRIAGEVYSNKPPLVNWLIASSFVLTGVENEWSARLPNTLILLAFGFFCILFLRPLTGTEVALSTALVYITAVAIIDKSRIAEIETVFVTLTGIAILFWIRYFVEKRSPWLYWTIPFIFLGVACLAKGPVHLVFWFCLTGSVLFHHRRFRHLFHPAHFLGILLMLGCFLPWMLLNFERTSEAEATIANWQTELGLRLRFSGTDWGEWLKRPVEILANFLPWTPTLILFWWVRRKTRPREADLTRMNSVVRGSAWGVLLGSLVFCLLPHGVARYAMPAFVPASFLLAMLHSGLYETQRARLSRIFRRISIGFLVFLIGFSVIAPLVIDKLGYPVDWLSSLFALGIAIAGLWIMIRSAKNWSYIYQTSLVMACGLVIATFVVWPARAERDKFPALADQIEGAVPSDESLIVFVDDDFLKIYPRHLRILFYLDRPYRAIGKSGTLPLSEFTLVYRPESEVEADIAARLRDRTRAPQTELNLLGLPFAVQKIGPAG